MLDLICHRYPGKRPSEYLDIKDSWTAFQLDAALAIRGYRKEETLLSYRAEVSNWHILQVCKSLGAKKIPKNPPKMPDLNPRNKPNELPNLSDLIRDFGGSGTVIVKRSKNG